MFIYENALLLLLILPIMALLIFWRARVRAAILRRIGDEELVRYLASQISPARRFWKAVLWMLATASLIVALARPVWGIESQTIDTQGVAIMVVLDVSASMDAQDVPPTRLQRAKLDLQEFFQQIEGNELGLILYAGDAFVQFPLTRDVNSAEVFLKSVNTNAITNQGTAMEEALRLALGSFDERIATHSIIVLVSDGENHEGDPLVPAQAAAERGVTIYTLGYGTTEGSPIPYYNFAGNIEYKADPAGMVVNSRLNEELLYQIAEITGGQYQYAGQTGEEIALLVERINATEAGALGSTTVHRQVERFGIFVALALLALSLEILLPETRRKAV